jgi:hypothetical protein
MADGEFEWLVLPDNNLRVVEFKSAKQKTYSGLPIIDTEKWAQHEIVNA